jgi:hypothetical protein
MLRNKIHARLSWGLLGLSLFGGCTQLNNGEALPPPGLADANRGANSSPAKEGAAQMSDEVNVSFSLAETRFSLHEPIILDFAVRNGSPRPVKLGLGQDRKEAFRFAITRPGGRRVELPPLTRDGISEVGDVQVAPQQTYAQRLLLNEWFDFDTPGQYVIEARLADPARANGAAAPAEKGFRATVEVGPRDAERLRQVSAALAEKVTEADSYAEAAEAALVLSHIRDTAAVPSLEKALTAKLGVEPIVIEGLERVGDGEAVKVLISALSSPTGETSLLARSALSRIEQTTPDPTLRERIHRALQARADIG